MNTFRTRRVLGCVLGLAMLLAACNSDDEEEAASRPRATVPTTTSTTAPADPYAIPDTIDVAYVQRVIDKLYEIEAEAVREIVREREIVRPAADKLQAVFLSDELNNQLRNWSEVVPDGLADFRSDPGVVRVEIRSLGAVSPECIWVHISEDFAEVAATDVPPGETYLVLQPKAENQDPRGINPTPWMIALDTVSVGGAPPADPCA